MAKRVSRTIQGSVRRLAQAHGGTIRTSQLLEAGIHPRDVYALRDSGFLEPLARGLYRLAGLPPLSHPDLVTVALKVPEAVVCLVSALAYHELTTQIPHEVSIAVPRGTETPRLPFPPIKVFWFSRPAMTEGIETHTLDSIQVRVFSPEKTVADCFKYRNKIGMEIALEALKLYRQRRRVKVDLLLKYAAVCRIERVMRPYLEAVL
jgi:predicted transcriptional regulator of viral defense system